MSDHSSKPILIAMVAGEASGDQLGAGLIRQLKKHFRQARFVGVGGERMCAEGFETLAPMEILSVMGIVEPLRRLPKLLALRKELILYFLSKRPALLIGIDSPDFTLGIEKVCRAKGIITMHYVCPSVWAWRQGRVKKIRSAVDHVLTLLPFEKSFLDEHNVPSTFVGHPLAEKISNLQLSVSKARALLNVTNTTPSQRVIAIMPGSRLSEISALMDVFLDTVELCHNSRAGLHFLMPAANDKLYHHIEQCLYQRFGENALDARGHAGDKPSLPSIQLVRGQSLEVMMASDVILLASGTATLEAALLKKPMVVAYRLAPVTYWLASRMVKVEYCALPNLLTNKPVVPEFIQDDVTSEALSAAINEWLDNAEKRAELQEAFTSLQKLLQREADVKAAEVAISLLKSKLQRTPETSS